MVLNHGLRVCFSIGLYVVAGCSGPGGVGEDGGGPSAPPHPGKAIYERYCFSCHAAGTAGAPKLGDTQAWETRLANGEDHLLRTTIDGIPPGMPARGLCSGCSDEELVSAIDYILVNSR